MLTVRQQFDFLLFIGQLRLQIAIAVGGGLQKLVFADIYPYGQLMAASLMMSIPVVAITGQVPKAMIGTDAFQETDVINTTMPVTKWNVQVTRADQIPAAMAKAFHIANRIDVRYPNAGTRPPAMRRPARK